MVTLVPKFKSDTRIPIFAEKISPDVFSGQTLDEIKNLKIFHGNEEKRIGELFDVFGENTEEIEIRGDVSIVREIGRKMTKGKIHIIGNAGMHLGAEMEGGEILVEGNVDDYLGAEMQGGIIRVKGNAGNLVGATYRGGDGGMNGGIIIIEGNAGNEVGNTMKLGTIVVYGNLGMFAGIYMKGGTIICFGKIDKRCGGEMYDGTIVTMNGFYDNVNVLPTFKSNGIFNPTFLRVFLVELRKYGVNVDDKFINGLYERFSGDFATTGKGEIYVLRKF